MTAFIPQLDPEKMMREVALKAARLIYQYNYTHVSPLAILNRVPIHNEFSMSWLTQVGQRVMTVLANRADLELNSRQREHHQSRLVQFERLINRGEAAVADLRNVVYEALKFEGRLGAETNRPEALEDYADLFRKIGLPPVAGGFQEDRAFSWMRVAGPNPVVLQRWREPDDRFPLTDTDLRVTVPDDSLEAAFEEGRMYLTDYALLDGAEWSDYPNGQKYLYAPLAAFVVEKGTGNLLPVAIQCKQKPADDNPIFTPNDGFNWLIAKTTVEIADGNMHEAFTHLGRTHLFIEPFVVSMFRQLAPHHPVAVLLAPHFQGTLAINAAAWQHLIANKGAVDKLFGGTIETSRGAAIKAVQTADVMNNLLPDTFAQRGVDDPSALRDYPYRDDSLLYWDAIQEWVTSYLRNYYETDAEVLEDEELQAWGRELGFSGRWPNQRPAELRKFPDSVGTPGRRHAPDLHIQRAARRGQFPTV